MTIAQGCFLLALSVVLLAVLGFTGVVLTAARRSGGGRHLDRRMVSALLHSPQERVELNRWAFYLHRLSGFGTFAFLVLHIADVSLYSLSRSLYDNVHHIYAATGMRVLEALLVFAILFHALNGMRLLAIDLVNIGILGSTRILELVGVMTLGFGGLACWYILGPAF